MDRPSRILVAEDSLVESEILRGVLESQQYEVVVALDGEQALRYVQSTSFDIVLSDIVMPVMDGFALCRAIKTDENLRRIPVMLLSALADPTEILRGLECGADNYLTKPWLPEQLLTRIRSILTGTAVSENGLQVGLEVEVGGKRFVVSSEKAQVLDVMIRAINDTVHASRELALKQAELVDAKKKLEEYARRLEGRIQLSEERCRKLMEQAHDAIVVSDAMGIIVGWNKVAQQTFGYADEEAIGQPLTLLMPERDQQSLLDGIRRFYETGESRIIGRIIKQNGRRKNGDEFPLEMTLAASESTGGWYFMGILRDVTEQHQMMAALVQAQKMEAIGRLAGGVAHDFNNLLTVICGFSDLILSSLSKNDPSHEFAREVRKAGQRATELTHQLLIFSRRKVTMPEILNLNDAVTGVEKMLRRVIGEDVELNLELAPDLGNIKADQGQIEQLLMNLVVNARDAMPTGGILTIETQNVSVPDGKAQGRTLARPCKYVMLAVRDTGCGMDDATQAHIFEPFFTTKEPGKGTGLGLATVYGIVEQFQGRISVRSELGRGSVFEIYFPRDDGEVLERNPQEVLHAPRGQETVLLVEDEDAVRAVTCRFMQQCGYNVLDAGNGERALEIAQQHGNNIQLLVTDVVLPRMSGTELANRISSFVPNLRVLYLSGYSDDSVTRHGILTEEMPFLQKPFTCQALCQKMHELLANTRRVEEKSTFSPIRYETAPVSPSPAINKVHSARQLIFDPSSLAVPAE